tara:strand:+ start:79 stop:1332 length:1254 start_codon:yes stop_codon:yes gene_type:complete
MPSDFNKVINCKLCSSKNLKKVMSFPKLPIGDKYMPKDKAHLTKEVFELDIMMCQDCHHYQNSGFVNPDLIYSFYLSRPAATNPNLAEAFKDYATHLVKNLSNNKKNLFAVEAGSNNGIFIDFMQKNLNVKVLGVEPSNLYDQAVKNNIQTINSYFSLDVAKKIRDEYGQADFFIANHTFSNVVDNIDFLQGVKHLLKDDGVFSMQTHYHKAVIEKNLIENFTHEHLSGFYAKPLKSFFEKNGMELFDVQVVPAKSGSIRCFSQKKGGPNKIQKSVEKVINDETNFGMDKEERHETVKKFIATRKKEIQNFISPIVKSGKKVAAYGTSTGATTFSFNYDLAKSISFLIDDDDFRQGLLSPYYNIPVVSPKKIEEEKPEAIIILAPLYADNIINKNKDYLEKGGKFIKIWPEFEIVTK